MKRVQLLVFLAVLAILVAVPAAAAATAPQAGLGNALNFSGTQYVQTPVSSPLVFNSTDDFTVEMWVKLDPAHVTGTQTMYRQSFHVPGNGGMQIWLYHHNGMLHAGCDSFSVGGWEYAGSGVQLTAGRWTHVAFVKSGYDLRLVVDGQTASSATIPTAWSATNTANTATIGTDSANHYFYGDIDDVRVSNVALSDATIDAWRYRGADPSYPDWANLVGYWNLDEASGSTAADLRTVGAATLVNSPTHETSTVSLEQTTAMNTPLSERLAHYDVDGGTLALSVVDQPQHGIVTMTDPATGAYTYTPDENFIGADSFTYKVWDGTSDSTPATVNLYVAHGWDGGSGATSDWSDATNWVNDDPPTNGDDVGFSGTANCANHNDLVSELGTVVFSDPGFNIDGQPVTLDTGIVNSIASDKNDWEMPTTLGGDATFTMTSGGTLVCGDLATDGHTLTVKGAGGTTMLEGELDDAAPDTTGSLVVESGTLAVTGDNSATFTGTGVVKDGGTLALEDSAHSAGLGGPVDVQAGGRLEGGGCANGISVAGTIAPHGAKVDCGTLLDLGDMTWQAGGVYECDITATTGAAGSDWDCLQAGSLGVTASAAHPFTIQLTSAAGGPAGFDPTQSYAWDVVQTQAGVTGLSGGNVVVDGSGFEGVGDKGVFSAEAPSDGTLVVRYTPTPDHIVTASVAGGHGSISPVGLQPVKWGATSAFSFIPDAGYHVAQVLVDGSPVTMTGADEYTFPAVTADHTISVSFALPPSTIVNSVRGGWTNHPVDLSFIATPAQGGAPVAYTEYRLGEGDWTRGTSVTVSAQGATTVYYRSADTEGNVEAAQSVTVYVDSGRPVVTDFGRPVAWQGGRARFTYRVRDAVAKTVSCRLVITRYGVYVTSFNLGQRPTGRKLAAKVRCNLSTRTYCWRVVAHDPAGNRDAGSWHYLLVYPNHYRCR